jgi:pyruvate ferredoxin oxidoreductase alpha subunit
VAGWRAPFVLINVSRGLAAPLTLEPDHNDVMAARDSGFLQIHCSTCQEVLDSVLLAFRIAEDPRVRMPVIVNMDGFYLSFTREPLEVPEPAAVAKFLPPYDAAPIGFRASKPISEAVAVLGGTPYSYFRYEIHLAVLKAMEVFEEATEAFARQFGRRHAAIDAYRTEDAEVVLVMMGSFATKARDAVDRLRATGMRVGLIRPRLFRPFPAEALRRALAGKSAVAVIDQNLSMGKGGILHAELASALYGSPGAPKVLASFVGGLGGRDISPEEFYEIAKVTKAAGETGETPPPRLLYTGMELRQMRKFQAIAEVERAEVQRADVERHTVEAPK